jgi:hypothetical protein
MPERASALRCKDYGKMLNDALRIFGNGANHESERLAA